MNLRNIGKPALWAIIIAAVAIYGGDFVTSVLSAVSMMTGAFVPA